MYIHTTENIVATWVAMPDVLLSRKACEQTPSKHHAKFFTRQLKTMPGVKFRLRMDCTTACQNHATEYNGECVYNLKVEDVIQQQEHLSHPRASLDCRSTCSKEDSRA